MVPALIPIGFLYTCMFPGGCKYLWKYYQYWISNSEPWCVANPGPSDCKVRDYYCVMHDVVLFQPLHLNVEILWRQLITKAINVSDKMIYDTSIFVVPSSIHAEKNSRMLKH